MRTTLRRSLILTVLAIFCLSASAFAQGNGPGGQGPQMNAQAPACQQSYSGPQAHQAQHQVQHKNHKAHQHKAVAMNQHRAPQLHQPAPAKASCSNASPAATIIKAVFELPIR